VVAENADVVSVMYASRVVEYAKVMDVFDHPQHPYTQGLLRSVPKLNSSVTRLETISGLVPVPSRFPQGCKFHPRCSAMQGDPKCQAVEPDLREVRPQHWARCHHVTGFEQSPITRPMLDYRREGVLV
jgi:oligopeptide/dipeptide ABC transporter ATP-binding protein